MFCNYLITTTYSCEEAGGFNLKYGNLENGYLEDLLISKMGVTGILKKNNMNLKINLKNVYLKKCFRN